jgi:hypothetical protein
MVLLALGAIWLSVRGQHPYRGPTAAAIPVLIGFIVVNFTATVAARHRATAGVAGKTRFTQGEIAIMAASWLAAVVLLLALIGAGVSAGHYPTTVLIIPGLAYAGIMVARAGWRGCAMGLTVAAIGVAGLFAGSAGSWAVAAVGLCAALLAQAAVIAWQQRA